MSRLVLTLLTLFASVVTAENNRTFPDGFFFGVASSAYQTEGAWDEDGKSESIWDNWIHNNPSYINNNDNADVASDSYHKYKEDIALASSLGATHYRFSISWPRILSTTTTTEINMKGILHYQDLIKEIINQGMFPVATLYHNDLPQYLQDLGGWPNPIIVDYFVQYAQVAFENLVDVKYWLTFHDPRSICRLGYGDGTAAPGIAVDGIADYFCAYVVLKSHAAVYHLYKDKFSHMGAKLSMAINFEWIEPATSSIDDQLAVRRKRDFEFGLYANPIYAEDWPPTARDRVAFRSRYENLTRSRLPRFTEEEIYYISGTYDFMAVNMYDTSLAGDIPEEPFGDPSYMKDMKANVTKNPNWPLASNGYPIVPDAARKLLIWLKSTYSNTDIFITENGVSDDGSSLNDRIRINYYADYLYNILDAMYLDEVKIIGYTAWSLLDGFEWTDGYSQRFGFFSVNFTDSNKTRTEKDSAAFYKELTRTLRIPGVSTTITTPITTTTSTSTTPASTTPTGTTPGSASRIPYYPFLISILVCLAY